MLKYVVTDIGKMCLYIWPYRVWSWRRLLIFRVLNVVSIAILFEIPIVFLLFSMFVYILIFLCVYTNAIVYII
ncbi:BTE_HP_G0014210.mRNA.1.CDS.1 [Saccharomyces cerevisiae]|nr:BTE_HP_G0014210.mRNA.1.CDS.1 [Saccharomyces cerevisiae]CAI6544711.1 BTE_HP_G0014210.mRNA.1.CDS.1 [Saccharomyces cerevisiae]